MMEWKKCTIGDITILKNGKKRPSLAGNIPVYGGNGIMDYVSEYNNDNTIIIGRVGAYCGCVHRSYGKCWVSDNAISVNAKGDNDVYFLYYLLKGINLNHHRIGGAQPLMTQDIISGIEVNCPPLSTQRRIASILSSLDRKIELNNKINAQLEEMAQALFKSWFVDFEPFKDGKFVESELGMIPEGWRVGTLGEITTNETTKVKDRDDVKVLSPVTTGELLLSEEYFTKQVFSASIAKYKVVKKGDFAYNPARVNIGSLGRNEFNFDGCVSPVYVVFSTAYNYENFIDLLRKTESFKTAVISRAIGGVRQSLSYEDFSLIETIIPTEQSVLAFNKVYDSIKLTIQKNNSESLHLSQLRDTLLPKLMNGEIEI